ncbi:MAG TPA: ATP-binding protein [Anaerolineales bacterium]|nr:ATP-binding protein [Anaerolineales bacterium]
MLPWVLAIIFAVAAVWVYVQYRYAREQAEAFRIEAKKRMQELASLGYSENKVGRRVGAVGEASMDAIIIFKSDHTVIYLNPAAEAMFGKIPDTSPSLIAITRHHELDKLATDALMGNEDLDRQLFINGRTYRARAAIYSGGAVICLIDVSELQRLGRARRDFIANISHELRTPLTAIRLLTDTLKSPAGRDPEVAASLVDKITIETDALSQLAQELFDLSAIESGQIVMKMVPTSLKPVVIVSVERLAELAARKKLTVTMGIAYDMRVLADAEQIGRVVMNLLHNAIKFTPEGERIQLRAETVDSPTDRRTGKPMEGRWVQVEVMDTGAGIARDDLPRIFERFYRADRARASGGTGLGLAIAKHIVEAHGGCIWTESEGLGRGATFRFLLPAA